MTFLVILMALLIERFFDWSHVRSWNWYKASMRFLSTTFKQLPAYVVLLFALLPIALIVWIVQTSLHHMLYGLVEFVFQLILFLYCLGPQNLWAEIYFCVNALAHGEEKQADEKLNLLNGITHEKANQKPLQRLPLVWNAAMKRVFAVMFWFLILGPVGAVIYRAIEQSRVKGKFLIWLEWPPVFVLTILFALGGHFVNVFTCWRVLIKRKEMNNYEWLEKCGIAALGEHEVEQKSESTQVKQAIQLFDRALIIVLVMFALTILLH